VNTLFLLAIDCVRVPEKFKSTWHYAWGGRGVFGRVWTERAAADGPEGRRAMRALLNSMAPRERRRCARASRYRDGGRALVVMVARRIAWSSIREGQWVFPLANDGAVASVLDDLYVAGVSSISAWPPPGPCFARARLLEAKRAARVPRLTMRPAQDRLDRVARTDVGTGARSDRTWRRGRLLAPPPVVTFDQGTGQE
jgi:hypothetical protein